MTSASSENRFSSWNGLTAAICRSLDWIEAMKLVEKSSPAGNVRRFLLVSDESFHPVTADGKFDVTKVRQLMNDKGILLDVFSRPQHEGEYRKLLGEWGNFKEIENFGKVLEEGRLLEN